MNDFKIENFKHKCYEYDYYEDNKKTYSTSRKEVENAIKYIYSVEKIN
ncbi:hypothetical protein [Leptotrichia hongkongensis]|nr:hypothetical protein [Leptotrichia hongkongensis]